MYEYLMCTLKAENLGTFYHVEVNRSLLSCLINYLMKTIFQLFYTILYAMKSASIAKIFAWIQNLRRRCTTSMYEQNKNVMASELNCNAKIQQWQSNQKKNPLLIFLLKNVLGINLGVFQTQQIEETIFFRIKNPFMYCKNARNALKWTFKIIFYELLLMH